MLDNIVIPFIVSILNIQIVCLENHLYNIWIIEDHF